MSGVLLRLCGAVLGGLGLFAAFPPLSYGLLAPVSIALLLLVAASCRPSAGFGYGLLAGCIFFSLHFSWAGEASGDLIPQLALALSQALFTGLVVATWSAMCRARWTHCPLLFIPAAALVWAGAELARSLWPFGGIAWGTLAFSQVDSPLVRLAPWGSTMLVSAAVVICGAALSLALMRVRSGRLFVGAGLALSGALIFALPWALPLPTAAPAGTLRLGYVQGIVPRAGSLPEGRDQALTVTENLSTATRAINPEEVDLVVWPESASDHDIREYPRARALVSETSTYLGVPLLLGTQSYERDTTGKAISRTNDLVVYLPTETGGEVSAVYSKQHPVPFGEYMPYRDFFRKFSSAVDLVSVDMRAGTKPAVLDIPVGERALRESSPGGKTSAPGTKSTTARLATPICFEVALGDVGSEAIRQGAQLYVVATNNASFGDSAESAQQFDMVRFRAVEYQRIALQVSTVGISGVVETNGAVRERTEPWTQAAHTTTVALHEGLTPAARFYPYYRNGLLAAAGAVGGIAWVGYARLRWKKG
ncbi:apolipoprotein N-acyltransferase [Actinotignum schaalii]|uniref:Apolipoprotein N-acyltransferase n=1 Tax=Actinotignum schaalii FB123-CNA-2 TaxID=883067 RepID=S2WF86_9ACTO|nr:MULTISPECIES: apolipoprotein N-acyltransferase [Actinotignum]EPD26569.1 apolipoprotein N-acyltransferase [Actinotignum schaalii FB123-CNA-2]MDK8782464.1 apolipoprotein N-acyltransferase [Actinotignum timonense]